MHNNNIHKNEYDFELLCKNNVNLNEHVFTNEFGTTTIDFSNPKAVKALNRTLLSTHYNINYWDFSDENLCPPIPSRVDYIHQLAELIGANTEKVTVLDIGTGATCIYPLLGNAVYNWNFVASDIDDNSLDTSREICKKNDLKAAIKFRLQTDKMNILKNIIKEGEHFTAVMCNPPFYKSKDEAKKAHAKKNRNLKLASNERNFSGNNNELWYTGGEKAFLHNYLYESSLFKTQADWFTSLVSKKENVKSMYKSLKKLKATEIKTMEMFHGNKITRIVAWRF